MKITIDLDDPEITWILSNLSFEVAGFAHTLRDGGQDIPRKCEAEQAEAMKWMLRLYSEHGEDWRDHANAQLRVIREDMKLREAKAQEAETK